MRGAALALAFLFALAAPAVADVTAVTIASRTPFSLDPADPGSRGIADLEFAPRGADGRSILDRAKAHWTYATAGQPPTSSTR